VSFQQVKFLCDQLFHLLYQIMKETVYSIKDLELLSGIKAHTIRIWEKRYGVFSPDRTETNIRLYCDNDLRKLLNIALLIKHGFRISTISQWDEEKVCAMIFSLEKKSEKNPDYLERLTIYMVNFDTVAFSGLIDEIIRKHGFEEAVSDVFFPFFNKIGTYWQVGSIFPAQEHYVSNVFRQKLIAEIDRLGPGTPQQDTILFFLHEKEQHELSLLFYSYLAKKHGLQVYYLGQSVPFDDLRKLGHLPAIKYLFTAFINSIEADELEDYLRALKTAFPGRKFLLTGRQLQQHHPHLPRGFKVIETWKDFCKYFG